MRRGFLMALMVCTSGLILSACSGDTDKKMAAEVDLSTIPGQFSYAIGHESVNLVRLISTVELDESAFLRGVQNALEQTSPLLSEADMELVKSLVAREERDFRNAQIEKMATHNKQEQQDFLKNNKPEKELITTDSGLRYEILTPGSGAKPTLADTVRAQMKITSLSGQIIDSTYQKGAPLRIKVAGNIPAWEEALLLTKEGGHSRFYVPYQLAYGEEGNFMTGVQVGPCQMLIMELELLEIETQTDLSDGSQP